jgi:hypothetical protein
MQDMARGIVKSTSRKASERAAGLKESGGFSGRYSGIERFLISCRDSTESWKTERADDTMSTIDPGRFPKSPTAGENSGIDPEEGPERIWPWFGRARWLAVLGGLSAGLLAFAIGEATHEIIPTQKMEQDLMGTKIRVATRATSSVAAARNGAVGFGILGACLGGCLGMAGGLSRRSPAGMAGGGVLGAVLGMALGAGVSWAALPRFIAARQDYIEYDLIISLAMHVSICGLVGAAAGLAFAVGLGKPRLCGRILAAGLLGAAIGAVAFEMIGAAAFPVAETDEPISKTWLTRLLARILVSLATAVSVVLFLPERRTNTGE